MKPLRRFSGARVGALTQAVFICTKCGCWQVDHRGNPVKTRAEIGFYCVDTKNCTGTEFQRFDSRTEAKAYASLLLREARGEIVQIELQPKFDLIVIGPDKKPIKIGEYWGDFRYLDLGPTENAESGERVVIDAKGGGDTHMSAWKRKHAEAQYGIRIRIMQF